MGDKLKENHECRNIIQSEAAVMHKTGRKIYNRDFTLSCHKELRIKYAERHHKEKKLVAC